MREAVIRDRENMNLLGLMLKTIVDQNLNRPWRYNRIRKLDRAIGLRAGKMKITIVFRSGEVSIERGWTASPEAFVEGSMGGFLGVALHMSVLAPWMKGDLKVHGKIGGLWPVALLTQVHPEKEARKK